MTSIRENLFIFRHEKPHWVGLFDPIRIHAEFPTIKLVKYILVTWDYHSLPCPTDKAWKELGMCCELIERDWKFDEDIICHVLSQFEYKVPTLVVLQNLSPSRRNAHKT